VLLGWTLGRGPLSTPRPVDAGPFGFVNLTDGRLFYTAGIFPIDRDIVTGPDLGDDWERSTHAIASRTLRDDGTPRPTALGFRGVLLNVNTIGLDLQGRLGYPIALSQVDPVTAGTGTDGYRTWLETGSAKDSCVLLTSSGEVNELEPVVDTPALESAARELGFTRTGSEPTPDGRTVTVWERGTPACAS
jgi:hypothetical protein